MTRMLALASVFVFAGGLELAAQQRSNPVPIPRPAPAATRQSPSTTQPFASALVFNGPRTRSTPLRGIGRGAILPVLPFFWGWGVPVFYGATSAQVVPLPADAPTGGVQLDITPW